MSTEPATPLATRPTARKGPKPSAETIRKRVIYLIGSANLKELDEAGYVVIPRNILTDAMRELGGFVGIDVPQISGPIAGPEVVTTNSIDGHSG